jgi:hypothetical protein
MKSKNAAFSVKTDQNGAPQIIKIAPGIGEICRRKTISVRKRAIIDSGILFTILPYF